MAQLLTPSGTLSYRCGFISLVGRPNVGKSTLLNALVGEKLAIVSPKPQTTRTRLLGVKTVRNAQLIFVDTPGIHNHTGSLLNQHMVDAALGALRETDMALFLIDAQRGILPGDAEIAERLNALKTPVIGVLNKIDLLRRPAVLPLLAQFSVLLPDKEIVPISALKGDNLEALLPTLIQPLPVGPALYPTDELTDQSERVLAQEMIREQLFFHTQREVPYSTAAVIEEYVEKPEQSLLVIKAIIYVERQSQKVIVIGERGGRIKQIGKGARLRMESFFGCRVFLELFVKVSKDWTNKVGMLRELGFA